MLSKFNVSMIVLAAVLAAAFNPPGAAARTRNAAAAAAATQDTDKPAPDSAKEQWRRTCKNSLEDLPGL